MRCQVPPEPCKVWRERAVRQGLVTGQQRSPVLALHLLARAHRLVHRTCRLLPVVCWAHCSPCWYS